MGTVWEEPTKCCGQLRYWLHGSSVVAIRYLAVPREWALDRGNMSAPQLDSVAEAWLHQLLAEMLDRHQLGMMVEVVNERILSEVPEIDTDRLRRKLSASTDASRQLMTPTLVTGATPSALPDDSDEFAEALVGNGLDLRVLMRSYRSGQQSLAGTLMEQVRLSALDSGLTCSNEFDTRSTTTLSSLICAVPSTND